MAAGSTPRSNRIASPAYALCVARTSALASGLWLTCDRGLPSLLVRVTGEEMPPVPVAAHSLQAATLAWMPLSKLRRMSRTVPTDVLADWPA